MAAKGFYANLREPDSTRPYGHVERRWRVSRARLAQNQHTKNWGVCSRDKRAIVIHTPLPDDEYWSSLWHETIHAVCPDLDESAVLRIEHALLEVSTKAGLFREDD
jgi:hypothetical protein